VPGTLFWALLGGVQKWRFQGAPGVGSGLKVGKGGGQFFGVGAGSSGCREKLGHLGAISTEITPWELLKFAHTVQVS